MYKNFHYLRKKRILKAITCFKRVKISLCIFLILHLREAGQERKNIIKSPQSTTPQNKSKENSKICNKEEEEEKKS